MIKAIFLDLDDFLIFKQKLFDKAQMKLFTYVSYFGFSAEEVSRKFDIVDTEMFKTHGFLPERLVNSFESVLKHFVPDADTEMLGIVRSFADEVFNGAVQLKPGVEEAVGFMTALFPVYIVTQGDKSVQEGFLSQLPFRNTLSGEFIVEKNKETYSRIVSELGYKPREVMMMGDSVESDIIPSHMAGLKAVWIPGYNSPLHDKPETVIPKGVHQFDSLLEAAYFFTSRKPSAVSVNDDGGHLNQTVPIVPDGGLFRSIENWAGF